MRLEDCDYICRHCGLETCRDDFPSPTEDRRVCADCSSWIEEVTP